MDGIVVYATTGSLKAARRKIRSGRFKFLCGRDTRGYDMRSYSTESERMERHPRNCISVDLCTERGKGISN